MSATELHEIKQLLENLLLAVNEVLPNETAIENTGDVIASPYSSPDTSLGYDTVLGYMSKNNPEAFDLMDDPITGTMRDGYWLTHQAKRRGLNIKPVTAPLALQEAGIATVNSYPVNLLQERVA